MGGQSESVYPSPRPVPLKSHRSGKVQRSGLQCINGLQLPTPLPIFPDPSIFVYLSSQRADGLHMLCSEETECRFCTNTLPDWRKALEDKPKAAPLMTVSHNGEVHVLQVGSSFPPPFSPLYPCPIFLVLTW